MLMAGAGERIHSLEERGFTMQPLPSSSAPGCLPGHLSLLEAVRRKHGEPEQGTEYSRMSPGFGARQSGSEPGSAPC